MITPNEILNKTFSATQLKRGYNEAEVDNYLDEVAGTLRELIEANNLLKRTHLEDGHAHPNTAAFAVVPSSITQLPIVPMEIVEPAPDVAKIITLAAKLHDQHVAEGERLKAELISQGQAELADAKWATADLRTQQEKMVTAMRQQARGIIAEAETEKVNVLACLAAEKSALTGQVNDLITARADARASIQIYYQEQLKALAESDPA